MNKNEINIVINEAVGILQYVLEHGKLPIGGEQYPNAECVYECIAKMKQISGSQKQHASKKCKAVLWHGPGHQSRTECKLTGRHKVHECIYGSYGETARWTGMNKCTGMFDEPPDGSDK